ncbi:Uncharacterized protein OBRU01_08026 [Operophtera brumata]|uniref:Glucose-6-phosphate 1-epimerase n=1 Tax=Operophtera brumata TaxID=104452 RepID=A0A0L7LI48_OPEBR|nr:Uncharacterized protein OBRU01_08026 [Operophtera brumata]
MAQFGQWAFGPQHGFARVARWHVEKMPERLPSGDVEAVFSLMDDDFTRSMWHFHCQLLLHTYFKVPDVRRCQITGMHGCMFIDKVSISQGPVSPLKCLVCQQSYHVACINATREGAVYQETRETVTLNEWTDRIYQNTMQEHIITNVVSGRKMRIQNDLEPLGGFREGDP